MQFNTRLYLAFSETCCSGMTCAMFVIVFMNVQIEKRAVVFGMLGSVPGFVFGSLVVGKPFLGSVVAILARNK